MQGLPQPPAPSALPQPAPVSPYQPAKGFDKTKLAYSFERWLMIGIILIIAATLFVQVVTMWGPPDEPAVDAELEELSQYLEDVDGYMDLNRVISLSLIHI